MANKSTKSTIKKVLLVGTILAEKQYFVDVQPKVNAVSFVGGSTTLTSSKVINAGRLMASKLSVNLLGNIGVDSCGKNSLCDLNSYKIKTNLVKPAKHTKSGEVVVITDQKGKVSILLDLGANKKRVSISDHILKTFDLVCIESALDLEQITTLLNQCKKLDIETAMDFPNKQNEFSKQTLNRINYLMPNRYELGQLVDMPVNNSKQIETATRKLQTYAKEKTIIVTADKLGCYLWYNETLQRIKAEKIIEIDSAASGDIFRGIFVSEILEGVPVLKACKNSVKIATESCLIAGVDASIKHSIQAYKNL